jgi:hypothetical protein
VHGVRIAFIAVLSAQWQCWSMCLSKTRVSRQNALLRLCCRYHAMLDSMEAAGIEPNATLHHFTHPQVNQARLAPRPVVVQQHQPASYAAHGNPASAAVQAEGAFPENEGMYQRQLPCRAARQLNTLLHQPYV